MTIPVSQPNDTSIYRIIHLSLILLIAGLMLIPAVSAEILYDEYISDYDFTGASYEVTGASHNSAGRGNPMNGLTFPDITKCNDISYIVVEGSYGSGLNEGENLVEYWFTDDTENRKTAKIYIDHIRNILGSITSTKAIIFLYDWDIGDRLGTKEIEFSTSILSGSSRHATSRPPDMPVYVKSPYYEGYFPTHKVTISCGQYTQNHITISSTDYDYIIELQRIISGKAYKSYFVAYNDFEEVYFDASADDKTYYFLRNQIDEIRLTTLSETHIYRLIDETTPSQPVLRTGTVTMTDNNGTTITGFEVTAVNAYTGESYTVVTETDVAVMNLPMERTIQIRNPQTGVYEEAPIGYYQFYGQSPGYKMLVEEGIQVAVMPEIYGSYKLCDIGVTSETGYLTGQHKFQIRSRSDNSILQSGTISAKSATTGEWYNTTVSGGIASLILPYDTSNVQSQYAGNYYVYATSPGYEDSEYGTQIVVMPHTVSEIRDIHLTPIGGIPTPGNVTLRIHVFSETGPGVVNAEIFIAGVLGAGQSLWDTYTASSTGYLTVSVPGNSTYDIVARGAGYYDSARRVEVFTEDPPLIEIKLYLSGAPTVDPTTQPTGWPTDHPTTQPTGGIPDEDDDSDGFLIQAVRGIGLAFGVGFSTAKLIFGMLLALSIGYATAKQLRGGAAEFGLGLLGGVMLGVLIGLLPVWIIVVLVLVVGLYIGYRYVGGSNHG